MFLLLHELLCTVSMTESLLIVPELCCRPLQEEFVLIKLKKGNNCLTSLSKSFHEFNINLHLFITDEILIVKLKKPIINELKIQLTENLEKKHLKKLKHSFEI